MYACYKLQHAENKAVWEKTRRKHHSGIHYFPVPLHVSTLSGGAQQKNELLKASQVDKLGKKKKCNAAFPQILNVYSSCQGYSRHFAGGEEKEE